MARLFIPQDLLDQWTLDKRAALTGEVLSVDGRNMSITAAVYFDRVAGGDADPHDLLGKVKDEEELATMGAELYHNSVIYGGTSENTSDEVAYDVVCGFVGAQRPGG